MSHQVTKKPRIAVVDSNILSDMGLKTLLQSVIPGMEVNIYLSFEELLRNQPENIMHFFVNVLIVLEHQDFFTQNRRKTIVLTPTRDVEVQLSGFHCISTNVNEKTFVERLLSIHQSAHAHGHNILSIRKANGDKGLSNREIEVLVKVVKGKTNKVIADELNIALTTVITHRRNIQEKLGMKTVSAMTVFAVTHGLVSMQDVFGKQ